MGSLNKNANISGHRVLVRVDVQMGIRNYCSHRGVVLNSLHQIRQMDRSYLRLCVSGVHNTHPRPVR